MSPEGSAQKTRKNDYSIVTVQHKVWRPGAVGTRTSTGVSFVRSETDRLVGGYGGKASFGWRVGGASAAERELLPLTYRLSCGKWCTYLMHRCMLGPV